MGGKKRPRGRALLTHVGGEAQRWAEAAQDYFSPKSAATKRGPPKPTQLSSGFPALVFQRTSLIGPQEPKGRSRKRGHDWSAGPEGVIGA